MSSTKKVQLRGGFSDRNKLQSFNTTIQLTNFDERTKIMFINRIKEWISATAFDNYKEIFYENLIKEVFCEFLSSELDYRIRREQEGIIIEYIHDPILEGDYGEVLTMIEYIVNYFIDCHISHYFHNRGYDEYDYASDINQLFQQEYVGYRFIDGEITPISDEMEVAEIEQSLDIEFQGCRSHIKKALSFLSDREKPDYKNSIKESISAVESICQIIIGKDSATLGKALKVLEEKGVVLHSALKNAFSSLYGYTSDEGGIRHAEGLFESNVTFEEAKYMLVSCCAFVNYLIAEYGKIK